MIYKADRPLLQPEICEKQDSPKPIDVTDEFPWDVGHRGCRRVHRSPRAVAVTFVALSGQDGPTYNYVAEWL